MSNIIFRMSSWSSVNFKIEEDSGISKEEWKEMSRSEQLECIDDFINNNIDVDVDGADD